MILIVVLVAFLAYFAPTIVALARGNRQKMPIALLNLFLGWTVLGWVGALIWSVMKPQAGTVDGLGTIAPR